MTSIASSIGNVFLRWRETSGSIQVQEPEQHERTTATDIIVPEVIVQGYQSILPLGGKYANAPFLRNLSEFLERYDQEIEELTKE